MRKKLIAGNWKMNLNKAGAIALAKALVERLPLDGRAEVAVCPPALYLDAVGAVDFLYAFKMDHRVCRLSCLIR